MNAEKNGGSTKKANPPKEENLNKELVPYIHEVGGSNVVKHRFCWFVQVEPDNKSELNQQANAIYRHHKKSYKECIRTNDYESALYCLARPIRTEWFIKNYKKLYRILGEEKYYSLLGDVLVDVRFHYNTKQHYSKLFSIGKDPSKMMTKAERRHLDKLPEQFTIYRGIACEDVIDEWEVWEYIGNSWTISKSKAKWFAKGHKNSVEENYDYILSLEIPKSQVLSYFTRRKEKEIFVDFTKLNYRSLKIKRIRYS